MRTPPSHEPRELSAYLDFLEDIGAFEPQKGGCEILLGGISTGELFEGKIPG
jgi:hypothetical protein